MSSSDHAKLQDGLIIGAGHTPGIAWELVEKHTTTEVHSEVTRFDRLDINPLCKPDVLHDLDEFPWPIPDEEYAEVHAYEVLEHLGRQGDWRRFFADFNEIARILIPRGRLFASTPAPVQYGGQNDWVWDDPGHTRLITERTLYFLQMRDPQPPASDYRTVIRYFWDMEFHAILGARYFFCLRKGEENPLYGQA